MAACRSPRYCLLIQNPPVIRKLSYSTEKRNCRSNFSSHVSCHLVREQTISLTLRKSCSLLFLLVAQTALQVRRIEREVQTDRILQCQTNCGFHCGVRGNREQPNLPKLRGFGSDGIALLCRRRME